MNSISIRNKLTMAILVTVITSIGIVAYVAQSKTQEMLLSRLQTSELPNLVKRIEESVSAEISQMKALANSIANNPFILDWVVNGGDQGEEEKLTEYLANIAEENDLSNASFIDRQNNRYWNQGGFLKVLDAESWFNGFKASGVKESASTYTNPNGTVDVFVNFQQLNGRGASGVSKSFEDIANFLRSFKLEKTGFVFLADSKGLIKVHQNRKYTDKKNIKEIYPDVDFSALFSKQEFDFQSLEDKVIASSYIESLGWYVVADIPKKELYASLDESNNYMLMLFGIVTVVFTGVSLVLSSKLVLPLKEMATSFQELGKGEGDLTCRVSEDEAAEIRNLAMGFNAFVANIRHVVQDVASTSEKVRRAAENVHQEASLSKSTSEKQRDETHQVSVAINEMGSTIAEIANSANVAAQTTNDATEMASKAKSVVGDSTVAINLMAAEMTTVSSNIESLADKARNITSVLEVISGISDQTNLLALNAAIEAARAGEHGRGFAVVADEVRSLAQRTNESADEIRKMISDLQDGATVAVESVHQSSVQAEKSVEAAKTTNDALEEIVANVMHISDLNAQIATATEEQSAVIKEINIHVVNINDSTEQNAQTITSIESSSEAMSTVAVHLDSLVGRFKV